MHFIAQIVKKMSAVNQPKVIYENKYCGLEFALFRLFLCCQCWISLKLDHFFTLKWWVIKDLWASCIKASLSYTRISQCKAFSQERWTLVKLVTETASCMQYHPNLDPNLLHYCKQTVFLEVLMKKLHRSHFRFNN